MRRCVVCGVYTLRERCPSCGGETASPHPVNFVPGSKTAELLVRARKRLQSLSS
ncbi:MAG: RNA-protein complex protein Nop10 [Aigarchaeota archaeon]|uniref:Ribosome biogenesis protein n=1 Tax=Caldiarchaeum subterraneum TaxID=311458 RepID=A0A7C4I5T0_CALS0|nr:RNA-protein complex protein Nop10 [Candidatus Caldarchaeales archaeon]MDJ0272148.1 RNA-protein complex protein Nop10 [Candidatus Caldarchaeales archaeon]